MGNRKSLGWWKAIVFSLTVLLIPLSAAAQILDEVAKLTASDAAAFDGFGASVSVSGDTAVVGARGQDDAAGSAYVFVRSGGVWIQQQKLTASDAAAVDRFGDSVSVSGDTAVVGAVWDDDAGRDSGSAYVFVRAGGVWKQQQKLTASDAAARDQFGRSVSVSEDTAVVGAFGNEDAGDLSGSAYVFSHVGACCDGNTGNCTDGRFEDECVGDQFTWHKAQLCSELDPPCEQHRGACCDHTPFQTVCRDDVLPGDCVGQKQSWHKDGTCAAVDCSPNIIPTMSEWGLAVMTLLLLVFARIYFGVRIRRTPTI